MGKKLPKILEPTVINLIKEADIMELDEPQTISFIFNVTEHTISHSYYWKLKGLIKSDNVVWIWNFGKDGYITEFRKRIFVFENTLAHVRRQYNLELARAREDQDTTYLKNLVDQMITLNTRITQLMMSSPMLAAIKAAMDPDFNPRAEDDKKIADVLNSNKTESYIKKIGQELGERQNIRLDNVYSRSNPNPESITQGNGDRQEGGGETTETGDQRETAEDLYRRQKDKGIFFNPE